MIVDVAFADGDFVVQNGDFVFVRDNQAIIQASQQLLRLQVGANHYAPAAGWDWMRWLGATVDEADMQKLVGEIRAVCESVPGVKQAQVLYLGNQDDEASFSIDLTTIYGTENISFAMGGLLVQL